MPRMSQAEYLAYESRRWNKKLIIEPPNSIGTDDESELHEAIYDLLRGLGVRAIIHSRMDMATTTAVGVPDFVFLYQGRGYGIEAKAKDKKPTVTQVGWLQAMSLDGWTTGVVRSVADVRRLMGL